MCAQSEDRAPVALITGASTGIGRELARCFAADGHDVVLVARSTERLQALAEELRVAARIQAHVQPLDLTGPHAAQTLHATCASKGWRVEWLVNNAGFGSSGPFIDDAPDTQSAMLQLNIATLTGLCRLFIADMVQRGRGRVLNVASMAGFQPGPNMAVYYATKAYVLSLSEALAEELSGCGVTVTVLCPGPTVTEFQKRASVEETFLFSGNWAMTAERVARNGYDGMRKGRAIVIPGALNKLLIQGNRLMPRMLVRKVVKKMQS